MVLSELNQSINYIENKNVEPEDMKHEACIYELTFNSIDIMISIGKEKYKYIDADIIYFPVYLIVNDSVEDQIGVFEVQSDVYPTVLDDEGDVDLEKLNDPLFYSFVNDEYLESFSKISPENNDQDDLDDSQQPSSEGSDEDEDEDEDDEKDDDGDGDDHDEENQADEIFEKVQEVANDLLSEQTKDDAGKERKNKKDIPPRALWIQKYMKSLHFDIIDNEGGGDCMFACVRDAFAFVGKTTTVARLRNILVNAISANPEIYENYKQHYNMYAAAIKQEDVDLKALLKNDESLKTRLANETSGTVRAAIVEQRKENKIRFDQLKRERVVSKQMFQEYRFMRGVKDIESFKRKISSCEFWGETWALSTLEKTLNVKMILLSHESYLAKDMHNVLQCGQLNDSEIQEKGIFEPEYYFILDYNGSHYKLITYKGKAALKFVELPFDLKVKIMDKCMETQGGLYSLIPDFQKFQATHGHISPDKSDNQEQDLPNDLYDSDIVFCFYSKSRHDKTPPGKGSGEKIPSMVGSEQPEKYNFKKLQSIEHWRRKLSHFYETEFEVDERKWKTIEHYFQAQKFKEFYGSFYEQFTLDSNSPLSQDPAMARAAGSTSSIYKGERTRPLNVKLDKKINKDIESKKASIIEPALYAKFSQNQELKTILLETKEAKLTYYIKGSCSVSADELMKVRKQIRIDN